MAENQNIEYKESWRDEYMKWICGFANAQGGKLYIGVKDNGEVCGVDDCKRLMEETLLKPHRSIPYNPDIANTFFRSGDIEAWGRGINHIITTCKGEGFSTPEFIYDPSGFWTIFRFQYPERAIVQSGTKDVESNQQNDPVNDPVNDPKGKHGFLTNKGLVFFPSKCTAMLIYERLRADSYISKTALSEILGVSLTTIKRNISKLKDYGLIQRVGSDKNGYWEIMTTGSNAEDSIEIAQALPRHCPSIPPKHSAQALPKHSAQASQLLYELQQPKSMQELITALHVSRESLRRRLLPSLINEGLVQMTNPENPKYMYQRYMLTTKGLALIEERTEEKGGKQ